MRVLLIVHGFPPTHSAGAERRAERMVRWLSTHDYYVEVLAIEKANDPVFRLEATEQEGVIVHRLYYDVKTGEDPFRNLYDHPIMGSTIRNILVQQHFDLVHIISGYLMGGQAIHTVREMGLPVVITLTEYWFMCARLNLIQATGELCSGPETIDKCTRCLLSDKRRYRMPAQAAPRLMDVVWPVTLALTPDKSAAVARRQDVLRNALDQADLVICPSQFLIGKFKEFGFDTEKYRYIRQGLAKQSKGHPLKSSAGGPLRVGYVGQIKPHKGVDLLLDAVMELLKIGEKIKLEIWGKKNEVPDYSIPLQLRSRIYPRSIKWHGEYRGAQVWDVLASLDVLVIPSRWYENSPTVILEAYKMGIPVVATDLGGMAELVEHEKTGLLFEFESVSGLRRQLERLLHEPELLERLRANIPHVKMIDEEMAEIAQHYHRLVAGTTR
jgi:glycosyltransferase involved in cell wall biosynthesis